MIKARSVKWVTFRYSDEPRDKERDLGSHPLRYFAMSKDVIMKIVLLSLFICLSSCSPHQTDKPLESNNPQGVASAKEDEPLNVDFCDLLQSPEKYEQKLVRIKAIYCSCFERAELFSLKCDIQKSVWVEGGMEKCKNSGRIDELGYAGHPGWNDRTVAIVALGKLIGIKGGYGQMNGYDYLFRIECLERAEIIDRKGNTPTGMTKEQRLKVEEFENSN